MANKLGLNNWEGRLLSGILLGASFAVAADPVFPPHDRAEPSAAIRAYAQGQEVPLEGFTAANEAQPLLCNAVTVAWPSSRYRMAGSKRSGWSISPSAF